MHEGKSRSNLKIIKKFCFSPVSYLRLFVFRRRRASEIEARRCSTFLLMETKRQQKSRPWDCKMTWRIIIQSFTINLNAGTMIFVKYRCQMFQRRKTRRKGNKEMLEQKLHNDHFFALSSRLPIHNTSLEHKLSFERTRTLKDPCWVLFRANFSFLIFESIAPWMAKRKQSG